MNDHTPNPNVQTSVTDANAGDVARFHSDDAERAADLAQVFNSTGEQHQVGGAHDLEMRAITTDVRDVRDFQQPQDADFNAGTPEFVQNQPAPPTLTDPNTPTEAVEQDFQKLYGQSENEKGELRKAVKELLGEVEAMRSQPTTPAVPTLQPQPYFQQPQLQPQTFTNYPSQPQQPSANPFNGRDEADIATVGDMQQVINSQISPAIQQLIEQNQMSQQATQMMQLQLAKQQAGITPEVEQRALAANPTLQYVAAQDYNAYLQQVASVAQQLQAQDAATNAKFEKFQQLLQPQTPPATTPVTPAQKQVVAQRTFVESGRGNGAAERAPATTVQQRMAAEVAEVYQKYPYGHRDRASAISAVLQKYGAQRESGYRDPSVRAQ